MPFIPDILVRYLGEDSPWVNRYLFVWLFVTPVLFAAFVLIFLT